MEHKRNAVEEHVSMDAANLAASIFWAFALIALFLVPVATRPGKRDLGWVQEPWSWPFIVLAIALIGGAAFPVRLYLYRSVAGFAGRALLAFDGMISALRYSVAFLVYLGAIHLLGFSVASILFMQVLYWMSGLRGGKWSSIAFAVSIAIILAFRIGLGIWFPFPPFMKLFPDWIGNALGDYL